MINTGGVRYTTRAMALTGALAALTAAVVGSIALMRAPDGDAGRVADAFPVAATEVLGLLDRPADLGGLGTPARLASCLAGLGYPGGTPILGARPLNTGGHDAVLLVVDTDTPHQLAAIVVPTTCSAADTGLLADTVLARP